jgi:hypothetical protein
MLLASVRVVNSKSGVATNHEIEPGETLRGEFTFETVAIERGGEVVASGLSDQPYVAETGELHLPRLQAREVLQNREEGLEQSWVFERAPDARGDVTVSLAVSGQEYVGETSLGLHFVDPETGVGTRYGRGTWIDALGERTDVLVAYADGIITLTVPGRVVDGSSYPAVLDPTVFGEFGVDTGAAAVSAAIEAQELPDIAYSGTLNNEFLVVWSDRRRSAGYDTTLDFDIYGVRVKKDGTILDTSGFLIEYQAGDQNYPHVAWGGSPTAKYYVTWRTGGDIWGASVDTSKTIADRGSLVTGSEDDLPTDIAWGSSKFLIVFYRVSGANYAVRAHTVTATFGSGAGTSIDDSAEAKSYPRVEWFSSISKFEVVWAVEESSGGWNIKSMDVNESPTSGTERAVNSDSDTQDDPDIACLSGGCLVVFADHNVTCCSFDISGRLLDSSGIPTGSRFTVNTTTTGEQTLPSVAEDNSKYLAVWESAEDLKGQLVTVSGSTPSLDHSEISVSSSAGSQYKPPTFATAIKGWEVTPGGATTGSIFGVASTAGTRHMMPAIDCIPNTGLCLNPLARFTPGTGAEDEIDRVKYYTVDF